MRIINNSIHEPNFKKYLHLYWIYNFRRSCQFSNVTISPFFIHQPEGVDVKNIKSIADNISLYEPIHFLMPYLAHAIGTFVAAYFVSRFAVNHQFKLAILCGVLFLLGGIMAVKMIPNSPLWFNVLDLMTAYIPMAWIGSRI